MNFDSARNQMLGQQIRTWDVLDSRVLQALRDTPREHFVPEPDRDLAFADTEIPLGHGQTMMNPKVEARLLQELRLTAIDNVLEVGTGSGYLTACLGRLAEQVRSVEIFADLSSVAAARIEREGINNVELETTDAMALTDVEQFDAIAITGSVPTLNDQFIKLLRPMGRLFVIVGRHPVMEARLITKQPDGQWIQESLFDTLLTPLINAEQAEPFVL